MHATRRGLLLAGAGALAAPAVGRAQADASLLDSALPDRAARLEAAARTERQMMLYTSIAQTDLVPLIQPFEEKYGIKVAVWRASGNTVVQRAVQERRASRAAVDAIHISAPEMEALTRENLFQKLQSPSFAALLPGAVPAHRMWASTLLSVWVQAYNTNLVKREELPKTYADLLHPRWKGRLGYEVENDDWFSAVVQEMGEEEGLKFFRTLVGTNGLSIRKGHSLLTTLVAAGEVPLALTVYNYMPEQAKAKGAPIDWFALEPAIARANGIGVARAAKSPHAAALFVEHMLGPAQAKLAELSYVPAARNVASPLPGIRLRITDPSDKLDNARKWDPLFQRIIVRGQAT